MDFQTIATSSLVAAVISILLNQAFEWRKRAATARAQLLGIQLELAHAERCATAYLNDSTGHPWAPGYRIATEYLRSGIMTLAASGALRDTEAEHLHLLYVDAEEANRSLELLAQCASNPTPTHGVAARLGVPMMLISESSRARMKFKNVLDHLPAACSAAESALERQAWLQAQD